MLRIFIFFFIFFFCPYIRFDSQSQTTTTTITTIIKPHSSLSHTTLPELLKQIRSWFLLLFFVHYIPFFSFPFLLVVQLFLFIMSVVGIDLGSQSTKIGVARNKGIDIVSIF